MLSVRMRKCVEPLDLVADESDAFLPVTTSKGHRTVDVSHRDDFGAVCTRTSLV